MKGILFLMTIMVMGAFKPMYGQKDTVIIKTSAQCDMCKKKIEDALRFEKGILLASVEVKSATATVLYNSKKTNPDMIRKAISMLGYDADSVPAHKESYEKLHSCCKKLPHNE